MREVAMQNREAIVRLCKPHTFSGVKVEQAFNFEYRAADATANPWLSLASIIYAMNDGLDSGKLLDRVLDGDLDSRQDLKPLPRSLEEAVLEFKGDNSAQGWFDEKLIATHVLIRDEEKKILSDHSDDEKCRRYSDVY
jgi:glutamine synthetase